MRIIKNKDKSENPTALTIGVFDGVHLGHQSLLKKLDSLAQDESLLRTVVTFDVHPLSIVAPGHDPKMLLTLERRLELLEKTGLVDQVLVITFDAVRAAQSAKDFISEVLVEQLNVKQILVGKNFQFGHERRGNVALLKDMGEQYGYSVSPVELLTNEALSPVSSTLIRQYISVGNVEKANELLSRPHELKGIVVHGDKIGTDLGYPTANTQVNSGMCIPADGVYGGHVVVDDKQYLSAISIGVRPMFHEDNIRVIEPHILDFSGDIYGQEIKILFDRKIRDQLVLESKQALIEQIGKDIMDVRTI
ncbi:MAG: bifunctional riboflavin kinase/FAD synthetase [Acidimicrobiia bacterium]